jgi:hypothetical protein
MYTLDEQQYLTGEQRLYRISAAAVHQMCCFHDTSTHGQNHIASPSQIPRIAGTDPIVCGKK